VIIYFGKIPGNKKFLYRISNKGKRLLHLFNYGQLMSLIFMALVTLMKFIAPF